MHDALHFPLCPLLCFSCYPVYFTFFCFIHQIHFCLLLHTFLLHVFLFLSKSSFVCNVLVQIPISQSYSPLRPLPDHFSVVSLYFSSFSLFINFLSYFLTFFLFSLPNCLLSLLSRPLPFFSPSSFSCAHLPSLNCCFLILRRYISCQYCETQTGRSPGSRSCSYKLWFEDHDEQ